MKTKTNWAWPKRGVPMAEIRQAWNDAKRKNIDYRTDPLLGFPGTTPLPEAVAATRAMIPLQPNGIGIYTTGERTEMGFEGTQALEKDFVLRLANLLGSAKPETEVDGYLCNGGNEGNDHGTWLGRNWLLEHVRPKAPGGRGIAFMTSFLTHYSAEKQFNRFLKQEAGLIKKPADRNILKLLPTNAQGQLDAQILNQAILQLYAVGYRRFLIVLTVGTINVGSIDAVEQIDGLLDNLKTKLNPKGRSGLGFYVHVDGAFGGLVAPFVLPEVKFGFQNRSVMSISVDMHKMGSVPYPAGVFLCRKGLLQHTITDAPYLFGHKDKTVPGSRSGTSAVACWSVMMKQGREGFRKRIQKCLNLTEWLRLGLINLEATHGRIRFYPTQMDILTVRLPPSLRRAMESKDRSRKPLWERYCVVRIKHFPKDLTRPVLRGKMKGSVVYRFLIMPHDTVEKIDQFLCELAEKTK